MKVQEVLENYNTYKASISIAKDEVRNLKNEMYDLKSRKLDGVPKPKGYTVSNLEEQIADTQEQIEKKERYIEELESKLSIVENLVRTLKKYNQDIIEMRFYSRISIEEIAMKKDRGYGAIQKTIDRSIEIMQKEYNKNKMY